MKLGAIDIPQVERLERVAALARFTVAGEPFPTMGTREHAAYLRAASILGWLSFDGQPTAAGFAVALCPTVTLELVHAGVAFERSHVGRAWIAHAGATSACELLPESARPFLKAATELRDVDIDRRASTLCHWAAQVRGPLRDHADLAAQLRGGEVTPVEVTAIEEFLALPCDGLVPTRMTNWARRNEVRTLRELALYDRDELAQEPNLGRKTLAETDALFQRRTGRSWTALRAFLASKPPPNTASLAQSVVPGVAPLAKAGWDQIRTAFPHDLRALPVTRLDLSSRIRKLCEAKGFATLGELLGESEAALLAAPNFSRRSLQVLTTAIRDAALRYENGEEEAVEPSLDDHSDWLTLVRARLELLRPVDRFVFTRRAGLDGNAPETLVELGEQLGVSRERVRQIEARALKRLGEDWWPEPMRERLRALLGEGTCELETLGRDGFFASVDEHAEAIDYVLERIIDADLHVVDLSERLLVAPIDQELLDTVISTLRRELRQLAFPIPKAMVLGIVERHTAKYAGLTPFVFEAVFEDLTTSDSDAGPILVGYGNTRGASMLAHLRASPSPVPVAELYSRFGRGPLPEEVVYLDRGVVGLPSHVPDFEIWTRRLVPLCVATMMARDPARQWSTVELHELLAEQARLPAWLGPWHLAAMIRVDGRIRYLGRQRVALAHEDAPMDRAFVRDLVVEVLREHSGPMPRGSLLQAVRTRGACSDLSFSTMILNPPFVPIDDEQVGLIDRDLPGGETAMTAAVEALAVELERLDRGLAPTEALAIVHGIGGDHTRWTMEIVSVAVRQSGTLILNRSGSIGMAGWSADRMPTRQSIVRELVDAGEGQAEIATVLAAIHAKFGTPCTRPALYNLAQAVGTRLRGSKVVDERLLPALAPELAFDVPNVLELPGFPATVVDEFQRVCAETGDDLAELGRAIDAHLDAYLQRSELDNRLAPHEARALANASRRLLQRVELCDAPERRLALASIRYFVLRNDAEMDFEVGGLDDDIAVMNAIAGHLGFVTVHRVESGSRRADLFAPGDRPRDQDVICNMGERQRADRATRTTSRGSARYRCGAGCDDQGTGRADRSA